MSDKIETEVPATETNAPAKTKGDVKALAFVLVVLSVVYMVIFVIANVSTIVESTSKEKAYQSALEMIRRGDYYNAKIIISGNDLLYGYKDSKMLYYYASLKNDFSEEKNLYLVDMKNYISEAEHYHGELADKISEFLPEVKDRYNQRRIELNFEALEEMKQRTREKEVVQATETTRKGYYHSNNNYSSECDYDMDQYSDFEDFYYDNIDDFDSLDDAEYYYEEHQT